MQIHCSLVALNKLFERSHEMARPIPFNGMPGPQALIPTIKASFVASTNSTP